jgi:hypothetical protein
MAQTSWAAMALMYACYPDKAPIKRAVEQVMSKQLKVSMLRIYDTSSNHFRIGW